VLNWLVNRVNFGLLSPLLPILLIGQLCFPALAETQPQVDPARKKVLVLHALEGSAPVFVDTDVGLLTTLELGGVPRLNQFLETLELRRHPSPAHRRLLTERMRLRYAHQKFDMIITMYPEALEFVLTDCRDIFPDVPILALYLPEGFELSKTDRCIIGHSAKTNIIGTFEIALKLVPGAKRVYVVSGAHPVDRMIEDRAEHELKKWEPQLEFHYLSRMAFEDVLNAVSTAPPATIILLLTFSQDITGKGYTAQNMTKRLSQVSRAPIFGLLEVGLGHGITGGSLINFERIGVKAGELVLDILRGTQTPDNTPEFLDVPPVPMFDWQQLRRWKLSEAALPNGSIVINRELSFWDFKYYILGGIAVILAQTILVIGLLIQKNLRKKAELSVLQKTEELDQFFNVDLDILGIASTDGYFLRVNPATEMTLGYSQEELKARPFFDFVHPDDLDRTREAISTLASQQKVFSFENRYRCKDGMYRWLEWSSAPAGNLIYTSARDITERKQAEEALKKSEENYRMLVETMTEGLGVLDENGLFTYVNDRLCEILGRFHGDIIGHPVTEFLDDANRSILREQMEGSGKEHLSPYEITWTRADGRKMTTLVSPKSIFDSDRQFRGSFAVITDITERKQMQEKLRNAAEEWQTTFDSIQDLVMILDPESKLVRVNAATLSFFKLPLERILGKHCYDLMHGTSEPVETCPLAKMLKTKTHEETELYDEKTGAWLHVSVDPVFDDKGQIIRVIHTVKDVTESKRAESEAYRARRELLRMERLSRMGELTASLAHELNQPLTAILSNAQAALRFLQSENPDLNELGDILQDISSDDKRAGSVIRSLRAMMKQEEREREPLTINELVREVVSLFHGEAVLRNVSIDMEFTESLPSLLADKIQLQQVVLNLMMNATEAMDHEPPERRKIVLKTRRADHGAIVVAVRDRGPGIEEEKLDRVFQPFFTTKGAGLGMGLSISRSIIEAHGGRLWAENNRDKGATFFFEIPISIKSGE
jgi:PAS domain S-box-containing protein